MPLVAHCALPTFARLAAEGQEVLSLDRARHQDIRDLHFGLLNMMPDAALAPTERQFLRLLGSSNRITQLYVHPFALPQQARGEAAQAHIAAHYECFEQIREQGLDGLIITGANPRSADITAEDFWQPLTEVLDWARQHVTSTLCACLATHATLLHFHGLQRVPQPAKRWGVFSHRVADRVHPLVASLNTRFDVPHSRWNAIDREQMEAVGMDVLAASDEVGVHLAVSPDMLRFVYFQGHPEYDRNSLLKEYKREVSRYLSGELEDFPPQPANYFSTAAEPLIAAFRERAGRRRQPHLLDEFPEDALLCCADNTWGDSGRTVFGNWLGLVYQLTHRDRRLPFMDGIDPDDPLGLRGHRPEPQI